MGLHIPVQFDMWLYCLLVQILSKYMPCFSLREFHPHLPDYYYIKVGLVEYCISICF